MQPPTPKRSTSAALNTHTQPMALALALAEQAIGLTDPNPRVGCVITDDRGTVLGRGHTQAAGGPHAEVMALRDAQAAGRDVRGATAWVTLEPCAHHGRTPPCCDALIAAGLARVVMATGDPNPQINGQGSARMRAAGLVVSMGSPKEAAASRSLNPGFFSRMERQQPWVRMKVAASMDGHTALMNGASQWITGSEARTDGHAWRRRAGAVLTGVGTVLADDPLLDVRLVPTQRQPLRVVMDSQLRMPPSARMLRDGRPVLIYSCSADTARQQALRNTGAEVVELPGAAGRPDLNAVLADLNVRQINELHLEAGATLNGAWLQAGLVDECLIYLAPKLLGSGAGMATLPVLTQLDQAWQFELQDAAAVGPDLRVRLTRPGAAGT